MNCMYSCLLIEAVIFIFRYKLSFRGGIVIFLLGLIVYIFSYNIIVMKYDTYSLKGYILFIICCVLEYGTMIGIVFTIEYENIYLASLIFMIYATLANTIMLGICSLSKVLSETQNAYLISYKKVSVVPALIILSITMGSGYLCARVFAVIYDRLKDKNAHIYKILTIATFSINLVAAIMRHKYYDVMASKADVKKTTQTAGIALITFTLMFIMANLVTYVHNKFEIKQMLRETEETGRWIHGLQRQYAEVNMSNRQMQRMLKEGLKETDIAHKALKNNVSLTGNIMLDTLFTYYSKIAEEKRVVFEIQSEITKGQSVSCERFYISRNTVIHKQDTENKSDINRNDKNTYDILLKKIDMITISDKILSLYFDEISTENGYIFVNIKSKPSSLMLDYEINKELGIDRLSRGACKKYSQLRPVRRIVSLKEGIVNCESKENTQRISLMFVNKE